MTPFTGRIFYLKVSHYDIVFGAVHYYGKIESDDGLIDVSVTRDLTEAEAVRINKHNQRMAKDDDHTYKAGEVSGQFFDEETLYAAAMSPKTMEKAGMKPPDILMVGSPCTASPLRVLLGPAEFLVRTNNTVKAIDAAYERAGGNHVRRCPEADAIENEWWSWAKDYLKPSREAATKRREDARRERDKAIFGAKGKPRKGERY